MMFDRVDLLAFLRVVDARLTRQGAIRLIGGAVVSLAYVPSYRTHDIDYAWADREVDTAVREIAVLHPDIVTGAQTGTYFAPYSYEERLKELRVPGLVFLRVAIPERHDLAIMKITRGLERDIDAVVEMHTCEPLDPETLVKRFAETWITGPQRLADIGFRNALDAVFGGAVADKGMRRLAALRDPQHLGGSRRRR